MRNVFSAFVFLALGLPVFGQTFGQISGLVVDSSGAAVAGATVTVTNPQTNFTRNTDSNESGNYSFPTLPPGVYNVKAEKTGFQTEVRDSVELQVQQSARIDFKLNVGAVTETVQVTGGAPLLDTENASVGTVIEEKRILDLPLNGRNFTSLIALSPNVSSGYTATGGFAAVRGGSDRGTISIAIAGQRREYMYFTLDGLSNTDVDFNTYAFLPSIDALQEFKVQTGIYSAEFGFEASQVNVSTKPGTNQYHGTVFEFLRNQDVDARPYGFTSVVPNVVPFKWNQFGFTLGGPVSIPKVFNGKDRLFFMSNYEGFRLRVQSQSVQSVPTQAMRNGDLSAFPAGTITNPFNNNAPFAGNIIPANLIAPQAPLLLKYDPLPNSGSGFVNNYLEQNNNFQNKDQFTQRIDFVESAKSSWFGRYSFQDETKLNAGYFAEAGEVTDRIKQGMISNTRVLSPALVNEFHFGTAIYHNILSTPNAFVNNITPQLGIPLLEPVPPAGWGIPSVGATPFSSFGDSIQGPWEADDATFQWADSLSWVHGAHSFKFGVEIRRDRYNETGNQGIRGNYTFSCPCATGAGQGSPFGDLLTGFPFRNSESAGVAISQFRKTSQFYYATDSWKVRSNFTVDIGLRYEFVPAWTSRTPDFTSAEIPQPNPYLPDNPITGAIPGFTTPTVTGVPLQDHAYIARDCSAYGQNSFYPAGILVRFNPLISTQCVSGLGTTLTPNDLKDFAPRIGLAWSPTPKTSVRAGFGMFYSQDMGNAFFDAVKNFFTQVTPVTSRILGATSNLTYANPLGFVTPNPCGTVAPYVCISTPVVFQNDPNRRTPYIVQQTFDIQRQLSSTMSLEADYLGSQGHRLEAHLSYNNVVPGPGSVASRSPYPEMVNILPTLGDADSNYQSLGVKFTRRLANGLSALLSYTFSKNLDDMSAINPADGLFAGYGSTRQPQTGWCIKCDYGLGDYNQTQRFVASVLYELPTGKGKQYLNHGIGSLVLGGWQLNSIFTKGTGFPAETLLGSNQSNSNSNSDRPNAVPGVPEILPNPTPSQWVNDAAFVKQPIYTFGNLGRNTVVGPGVTTWDFSTFKNFNFTETRLLQFRFECFNCANHPVFGDPIQDMANNQFNAAGQVIPGTGNFGTITTTRAGIDMREMQFSLKLIF